MSMGSTTMRFVRVRIGTCMEASACRPSVVLPELSGPYSSTMRPRGRPPPRQRSSVNDPDGNVSLHARRPPPPPRRVVSASAQAFKPYYIVPEREGCAGG
jgi:hypothetical protein